MASPVPSPKNYHAKGMTQLDQLKEFTTVGKTIIHNYFMIDTCLIHVG